MATQSITYPDILADHFNMTSIFSAIQKTIISKDFNGGTSRTLFGKTEVNLSYSDMSGIAILDVSQAFGETVITVPADWRVETDIARFFAATNDHSTKEAGKQSKAKVLIITGISFFANLVIKNSGF